MAGQKCSEYNDTAVDKSTKMQVCTGDVRKFYFKNLNSSFIHANLLPAESFCWSGE